MPRSVLLVVVFGTLPVAARPADAPRLMLKHVTADPPVELAAAVRKVLPGECEQVVGEDGNAIAEFWFHDDIPCKATEEQVKNGLTYRELPDGVLLGAVRFPKPFVDYRKQTLPAGVYTLRFAVQPDTGDHSDTAPHTEFVLLSPATDDTTDEPLETKALVKLSMKVTGGDHPAVMLLFPHRDKPGGPTLKVQKDGAVTLAVYRTVVAGEAKSKLGFALTVSGHSKLR